MTADLFDSSRYSIDRAKRHIGQFTTETAEFFNSGAFATVVEPSEDGSQDVHKIKLVKPFPTPLKGIAFDAANNLRSALDQAGFATARAAGTRGRHAKFPFGDTPQEVESRRGGPSREVPKEIFDAMVSLKPYQGGNDLLWGLNKLANTNKHEIVVPVAVASGMMHIHYAELSQGSSLMIPLWNRAKNEMEVARSPRGVKPPLDIQVRLLVVVGDAPGVGGEPAVDVLDAMLREVESALTAIETEARRIGLVT